jgi:hypothetical protein
LGFEASMKAEETGDDFEKKTELDKILMLA